MKLLQTINENDFEPEGYVIRKVVRCVILDESANNVLFFGNLLVGGGVEEGESDEDAMHREAMEEVGAKIEIIRPLGEVISFRDYIQKKYIVHGYLCRQIGDFREPTTQDPEEHGEKRSWVNIKDGIQKLESEIAALIKEEPSAIKDDLTQRRISNRQVSLAFLKEI